MKKLISIVLVILMMFGPAHSRASMFGEETAVLIEILANAIKQLHELQSIVNAGQDTLGLLQDINKGINDSMALLDTIGPHVNPGLYGELVKIQDAVQKVQSVYGMVAPSPDSTVQKDTDQGVAEAISLNSSIYAYTKDIDAIGEKIKDYSHAVSPGGAQKLTAQTLGIMLHVMNQSLRAQATGLKLQAQNLAIQNKKDKEQTKHWISVADTMKTAMKSEKARFDLPRFK